jgi:hypothetical protein
MADLKPIPSNHRFQDLTGIRVGMLVVQGFAGIAKNGDRLWLCQCDCGTASTKRGCHLMSSHTTSCGCRRNRGRPATHTVERVLWCAIKQRCHNPNNRAFRYYGERGIVMCESWRDSFDSFIADMGSRPSNGHSIDRIDNDGPYAPWNCRWATRTEQARNKRNNVILTHSGQSLGIVEWSVKTGISKATIYRRKKLGWSDEKALTTAVRRSLRTG